MNWYKKANNVMYWMAGNAGTVAPGTIVPKARSANVSPHHDQVEQLLERIRQSAYANKPSRMNCNFVCPDMQAVEGWRKYWPGRKIYEVKVDGNMHIANGEYMTEIYCDIVTDGQRADMERLEGFAHAYWSGENSESDMRECLVDGIVTVIREIQI